MRVLLLLIAAFALGACSWGRMLPCECRIPEPPAELMKPLPPLPPIPGDLPERPRART